MICIKTCSNRIVDEKCYYIDAEHISANEDAEQQAIAAIHEKTEYRRNEHPFAEVDDFLKCRPVPLPAIGNPWQQVWLSIVLATAEKMPPATSAQIERSKSAHPIMQSSAAI